jgi:hypothetical protein
MGLVQVRGQLGYPSPGIAKCISEGLYDLRRAATDGDPAAFAIAQSKEGLRTVAVEIKIRMQLHD